MSSIAIITARGGSKRIPNKNIKEFCGQPILNYSIKAALSSGIFDVVMVSTDSEIIKEKAIAAGAEVPFLRSHEASNDYSSSSDALREVLERYREEGTVFDYMCCIYPTAPFVTAEKLKKSFEILQNSKADSVMPVVRFSFPPQRGNVIRDGLLEYQYPEYQLMRSQDLEPIFHDAGQFYFYRILENNTFCDDRFAPLMVSELEVQDIDNESDWVIAEMKYEYMMRESR